MAKWLLTIALLVSIPSAVIADTDIKNATRISSEIQKGNLPILTQNALNAMVRLGNKQLRRKGYKEESVRYQAQWDEQFSNYLLRRDIGDFRPLSQWLCDFYENLEARLGKALCDFLHLSDIKTLNHCIPVVFNPCWPQWGIDDYYDHFVGDGNYYGLVPVVSYWVINVSCIGATFGLGAGWICGIASTGVEMAMYRWVAPKLSDRIYNMACGQ